MLIPDEANPLVSVVALCYNQEKFLDETLDSIRNQTYKNIELIIGDDYSLDDSRIKITKWINQNQQYFKHRIKLIFNEQNIGITKSANRLAKAATGYYACSIACDDVMLPDKITTLVQEFSSLDFTYIAIYTDAQLINEEGNPWGSQSFIKYYRNFKTPPSGYIFDALKKGNFIPWPSLLMKTEAFQKIGYLDEDLCFEDWDFLLRLSKYYKIHYYPRILAKYRFHSNNYNNSAVRKATDVYDAFRVSLKHSNRLYFNLLSKFMLFQFYYRGDVQFAQMLDLYIKNISNDLLSKILSFKMPFKILKSLRSKKK